MTRILVIEDSPTQAAQYALILEDAGFEVRETLARGRRHVRIAIHPPSRVRSVLLFDLRPT